MSLLRILVLLLLAAPCLAKDLTSADWYRREAFVDPAQLAEAVVAQWRGGEWREEGLQGQYRVVVTQASGGANKLYVQWLLGDGEVAYSMSVKELNLQPEYRFPLPACVDAERCQQMLVKAEHAYEATSRSFVLSFDRLGHYTFRF